MDITKNVVKAMQLDSTRRAQLIAERTPWYTRGLLTKFAGVEGSNIFKQMEAGQTVYLGYLLTKP
ncbi:MAG: hypothetical protein V2I33_20840, partial [Kangiellaceae bacterium]|nr:hypothetical protein [Kangiellaceae bacterium]